MKRILGTFTSSIALALIAVAGNASSSDQIAAESKRANEFFDKCWDETLARHPVDESFYGIKTHYDQLEDFSDEKAAADHAVWQKQLATLKRDFKPSHPFLHQRFVINSCAYLSARATFPGVSWRNHSTVEWKLQKVSECRSRPSR
jgi:hypothetical protein